MKTVVVALCFIALSPSSFTLAQGLPPAQEIHSIASDPLGGIQLGAKGYDLTRLFPGGAQNPNDGKLVIGNARNAVVYQGVTFLFETRKGMELFAQKPEYFIPGLGGYCLLGLQYRAIGNVRVTGLISPPGDPAARTFANGRWHFHGSVEAEEIFEEDPDSIEVRTREATTYFSKLKKMPLSASAQK